jgi:hypothetical protein
MYESEMSPILPDQSEDYYGEGSYLRTNGTAVMDAIGEISGIAQVEGKS